MATDQIRLIFKSPTGKDEVIGIKMQHDRY